MVQSSSGTILLVRRRERRSKELKLARDKQQYMYILERRLTQKEVKQGSEVQHITDTVSDLERWQAYRGLLLEHVDWSCFCSDSLAHEVHAACVSHDFTVFVLLLLLFSLISLALCARENNYVCPQLTTSSVLNIEQGRYDGCFNSSLISELVSQLNSWPDQSMKIRRSSKISQLSGSSHGWQSMGKLY